LTPESTILTADYCEDGVFVSPINIMVTDAAGSAARRVITHGGRSQLN
jgi:hypothetical protein